MYKLSIITINKNNAVGLEKTIQSVINQTYFHQIEYLIIDGLSTDSSSNILEKYKDYFSYCISEKDEGIYDAMNKGIQAATGEYLLFLNSGDRLYHNKIIQEVFPKLNDVDIIYGGVEYDGEKNRIRIPSDKLDYEYFFKRKAIFHQASFISRKLFSDELYDTSYKIVADNKFFFNAICVKKASYKRIFVKIAYFDTTGISQREIYTKEKEKTRILLEGIKYIKDEKIKETYLMNVKHYNRLINKLQIDLVLPYVNNTDPVWMEQYKQTCIKYNKEYDANNVRYRDYGTLKYLLRGIEKNLPWIRNVYIIVEQESQIPEWLNIDSVKIIYHKDIIPEDKLPTYNSGTIEVYLKNIPELSEHFIYINDDMFPIALTAKSDFFDEDSNPVLSIKKEKKKDNWKPGMYDFMVMNSNYISYKDLNLKHEKNTLIKWNHSFTPMKKSTWDRLFERHQERIENSCTTFRTSKNTTQELVNSWHYLSGNYSSDYTLSTNYLNIGNIQNKNDLLEKIRDCQIICLNDGNLNDDSLSFEDIKKIILEVFEELFPEKSKYEL